MKPTSEICKDMPLVEFKEFKKTVQAHDKLKRIIDAQDVEEPISN